MGIRLGPRLQAQLKAMSAHDDGIRRFACLSAIVALVGCGAEPMVSPDSVGLVAQSLGWVKPEQPLQTTNAFLAQFGSAVAFDGSQALVGAPAATADNAQMESIWEAGTATALTLESGQWVSKRVMNAPTPLESAFFGASVAIAGNHVAIGAPSATPVADAGIDTTEAGLVYVLSTSGGDWSGELQTIVDSAQAAGRQFGSALALYENTLLVGIPSGLEAPGAVDVFHWSGSQWELEDHLLPPASVKDPDYFGGAVALGKDVALVGAEQADGGAGAVYVFTRSNGLWVRAQKLVGKDTAGLDHFGSSLSLNGEAALIAAIGHSNGEGAAYVFSRNRITGEWNQDDMLLAADSSASNAFGRSVALGKGVAWVGAPGRAGTGDVYPFGREGTNWAALPRLGLVPELSDAAVGTALAASGGALLVGAPYLDDYRGRVFLVQLENGSPCEAATDCASGHCVEGACCNSECDELCNSCLKMNKASGADGTCEPVLALTNPRGADCRVNIPSSCGTTGTCDGAGRCALYPKGTECRPPSCTGTSTARPTAFCDGRGSCELAEEIACNDIVCREGACLQQCDHSSDCTDGHYCHVLGNCVPQHGLGSTCGSNDECRSGSCADGVCCDRACDGQCEACSEPTSLGTCRTISGVPRGEREACEIDAQRPCQSKYCDGRTAESCMAYAAASTTCEAASCNEGVQSFEARCDGNGSCRTTPAVGCGNYACGENACLAECETDLDCVGGSYCDGRHCISGARCSADNTVAINEVGDPEECSPYKCINEKCLKKCTDISQCAEGDFFCNRETERCEAPGTAAVSATRSRSASCGLAANREMAARHWLTVLGLLGSAIARRKRFRD